MPHTIDAKAITLTMAGRFADFYCQYTELKGHGDELRGPCPIHAGEGPNFVVNQMTGLWSCKTRGCGKPGGDVFGFVMLQEGVTFPEAVKKVADWAGVRPADFGGAPTKGQSGHRLQAPRRPSSLPKFLGTTLAIGLHQGLIRDAEARAWLRDRRGLTDETLARFQVGIHRDERDLGLWRATFPVYDAEARLINVRKHLFAYCPDLTDERRRELKKTLPWGPGLAVGLFPMAVLDGATDVLIVGGEPDALLANQMGFAAVSGTSGEGSWKAEFTEALRGKARVTLLLDSDQGGDTGRRTIPAKLTGAVGSVHLASYPDGMKDLTEWVIEHGATDDDLRRLIENAPPWKPGTPREGPEDCDHLEESANTDDAKPERVSQATQLTRMALLLASRLFTALDGAAYAIVNEGDTTPTLPIRGKEFRNFLRRHYYKDTGQVPSSEGLQNAIAQLEAEAGDSSPAQEVFRRIARKGDALYLDLANDRWEAVEVTADGWRIITGAPVAFRRGSGQMPLPSPERGGSLADLAPFVNVSGDDWTLFQAALIGALNPDGPHVITSLNGEQGTAKTTATRLLKSLLDPNLAPVRIEPKEARDVMIAAGNNWLLAYDNLSRVPPWFSDLLCCLSTGGGYSTRTLYSDDDETILSAKRPVVVNGIGELAERSDLLDRALLLTLEKLPEDRRRDEATFWAEFEGARPRILGALLDAAACALRRLPSVRLERSPRMADFARWVAAAEPAMDCAPGAFLEAYERNRAAANSQAVEGNQTAEALRQFMQERDGWSGTATQLLELIRPKEDDARKAFAKNAKALSQTLKRLAPNLRAAGIDVEKAKEGSGRAGQRVLRIKKIELGCETQSETQSETQVADRDASETQSETQVADGETHETQVAPNFHFPRLPPQKLGSGVKESLEGHKGHGEEKTPDIASHASHASQDPGDDFDPFAADAPTPPDMS